MVEIVRNTVPGRRLDRPESEKHLRLKELAVQILTQLGAQKIILEAKKPFTTKKKTRTPITFIDVLGEFSENKTVAIECGSCNLHRIEILQEHFTVVVHLPYCCTPELVINSQQTIMNKIRKALEVNQG